MKIMEKPVRLERIYCAIGAILLTTIAVIVLLAQRAGGVWSGCIVGTAGLGVLAAALTRWTPEPRAVRWGSAAALSVLLAAQIGIGLSMRYVPAWDLDAIYGGAIEWVETSTFSSYTEYFQYFPNNLGGLLFYAALFKPVQLLGGTDYFAAAVVANSVLITGTAALTVWIASKWYGASGALWALAAIGLYAPVYFMGAVFYTDTLSMIFPVAVLALNLRMSEARGAQKYLWAAAMGAVLAAGMRIKFTVLIAFVAVAIDAALHFRRRTLLPLAAALAIAVGSYAAVGWIFYPAYLDPAAAAEMNTPIIHWIMMGLRGSGGYNPEDYAFTRSFTDPAMRDAAIWAEIRHRVRTLGGCGMAKLWGSKWAVCFGDGTFVLDSFLDDTPLTRSWAHEFVMRDGRFFPLYNRIAQAVWDALLVLSGGAALRSAVRERGAFPAAPAILAIVGIALFALMWESSSRLVLNFWPVTVLAASGALNRVQCNE